MHFIPIFISSIVEKARLLGIYNLFVVCCAVCLQVKK